MCEREPMTQRADETDQQREKHDRQNQPQHPGDSVAAAVGRVRGRRWRRRVVIGRHPVAAALGLRGCGRRWRGISRLSHSPSDTASNAARGELASGDSDVAIAVSRGSLPGSPDSGRLGTVRVLLLYPVTTRTVLLELSVLTWSETAETRDQTQESMGAPEEKTRPSCNDGRTSARRQPAQVQRMRVLHNACTTGRFGLSGVALLGPKYS